ncbi:InlB B-repeat-containing protein [Cohnella sp. GCM10020058]|uniref:InlB B-repeat-containing protein n=1 Tax=Cohnella sp. GCM10020058 TaxID=3317330 RepID=UPI003633D277
MLACLLALMAVPFMGTGTAVHATSPTWAAVGQTEQPSNVQTFLKAGGTLYAGTGSFDNNDVWSNSDGTWTRMSGSPSYVRSLLVDAGGTLYAGAWGDGNNVSTYTADDGWAQMIGSPGNVYALVDVNGTIYAGASNGSNDVWTYTSNDGWTQLVGSPGDVQSLVNLNGTLYALTLNNGAWAYSSGTWGKVTDLPKYVVSLVDVDGTLYAGASSNGLNRVWIYSNGTWTQMSGSPSRVRTMLNVDGTLYVGTNNTADDLWTYTVSDGWTHIYGAPANVYALLDDNGTLYAGAQTGGKDVWTNSNGTWTQMGGLPGSTNTLLSVDGTLYAGSDDNNNAVWAYTASGGWTRMIGSPGVVYALIEVDGTLYAGTGDESNEVWTYDTNAAAPEWLPMATLGSVNVFLNVNGTLYAGANNGNDDIWTYDTTASSPEWTQITAGDVPIYVNALVNVDGTLYAGSGSGENDIWTYDTTAAAPEWTRMTGNVPKVVHALLNDDGTLYAGTSIGLNDDVWTYDTTADEPEWTQMTGAPGGVNSLILVDGTLYAGADNNSDDVWSYSGGTWEQLSDSPSQIRVLLEADGNLYAGGVNGVDQQIAPTYTLTYDDNGATSGNVPVDSGSYARGDTVSVCGNTGNLAKTGYTFAGWNTAADGSGTSYEAGSNFNINTSDVTLYAQWTINAYTVSFNSNGGSAVDSQPVNHDNTAAKPADPTRSGYAFGGWYGDSGLTTSFDFAAPITADTTLYAKWTINTYTVSFNSNGGSAVDSQPVNHNGTATKPADPTRSGYAFGGWYGDSGLTTLFDFASPITADTTLYAKWTINAYTVSFNSNGGSAVNSQPVNYNGTATKPADPTRSGYAFGGWYGDSGLTTPFDFAAPITADTTLYAKWTINAYTVSFDSNEGSAVDSQPVNHNGTATKPVDPTRSGYTFGGWFGDSGLTTQFNFAAPITADTTLYAKWTAINTDGSSGNGGNPPVTSLNQTVISTDGKLTLATGRSGEVSLGDEVKVIIPADASNKELKLTIEKVADTQKLLTSKETLVSPVFEILKNFSENFSKEITLIFTFDSSKLKANQKPSVYYYDEVKKAWVEVGGEVKGNTITVKVNHFTKYAVLGANQGEDPGTGTEQPANFSDISRHWAEASIKQAVSLGIVKGYPDGTFNPNRTVTRAEFAVMLMNALKPQVEGTALTFTDKEKIGAWAQKSVAQAVQAGILAGYEDGTFRPNAEITRAEMAVMIAKAWGQSAEAATATGFADDKDIPAWAKGAVGAVKKLGIIEGKGANAFAPGDKATRAESVTVLLKMLAQSGK